MAEDIPYDKSFSLKPGEVDRPLPGVRRLVAPNPGPFTFHGTLTYIVGEGTVAILDPGPDDPAHIAAVLDAVRGETVSEIVITHTHRDHSPAARAVAAATGARIVGCGPHRAARPLHIGEVNPLDASADLDHKPALELTDGEGVSGPGWSLVAIETPGHTANHLCFAYPEAGLLFSGDHVMAWATSIVAPPDGAMPDYMASLRKLRGRPETVFLPGHGAPVRDAPLFVEGYIRHREAREASILHRLAKGEADVESIVRAVYIGLDPRLIGAASLSTLAHLEDLVARGLVDTEGAPAITGRYRLA